MSNNPGLDYGHGQSNVDPDTGIRYGVIAQGSVNPDCWNDAEPQYGEATCPECGNVVREYDDSEHSEYKEGSSVFHNSCRDYACESCELYWQSEDCFPDEPIGYSYDGDGYKLTDCLDFDIFVLKSPYYTYAQFCSPCVPGAGNLDTPTSEGTGAKCYALGHDWFDDNVAPYPVWEVSTGKLVEPEHESEKGQE